MTNNIESHEPGRNIERTNGIEPYRDIQRDIERDYDVLIVGARCAGAATALLLARRGLRVLVIDRAAYGSDTMSTHALTRPSVLQLSRWGVLDAVREAGTPTVTEVQYSYGDNHLTVPIKPIGDVDGVYAPRRTVLDRLLVDEAVRSGATVAHRIALRSVEHDSRGRVTGAFIGQADGPATAMVRVGLVIGADGARSAVARAVGAPVEYRAPASSAILYRFVPGLPTHAYRNLFQPGLTAAVIPTNGGQANVSVGVSAARYASEGHRDPDAFFHRILAAADPDLAAHVRAVPHPTRLRVFSGWPGFARQAAGPGWALVGDACYFKDPLSAHGMTDALISAELLARSVIDIADGVDETSALAHYAFTRRALAAPMMPAVAHLASFQWTLESAQAAQLEINQAMRAEWEVLSRLPDPVRA
ncbi:MAG: monooxygenase FAD-binding [Acidimicrobiia bacterium]|nr:monooxygenase FAD-binding [Acidimicrobiia bacterium]